MKLAFLMFVLLISCSTEHDYEILITYNVLIDEENDNYSVFIMNEDGSNPINLTQSSGVDWVYKAVDDNIYYISDKGQEHRNYYPYIWNLSSGVNKRIYDRKVKDSYWAVTSDGKKMILTTAEGKERQFHLIDDQGNLIEIIHRDSLYLSRDPEFIEDESKIAFVSRESGQDEMWTLDLKTKEKNRITFYPKNDTTSGFFYHAGPPVWNPKLNMITYISKQNGNHSIFAVSPDGKIHRQLTDDTFHEGWFGWNSDYSKLVFDGHALDETNYDIYISDHDGLNRNRLTNLPRYEQSPHFVRRYRSK